MWILIYLERVFIQPRICSLHVLSSSDVLFGIMSWFYAGVTNFTNGECYFLYSCGLELCVFLHYKVYPAFTGNQNCKHRCSSSQSAG